MNIANTVSSTISHESSRAGGSVGLSSGGASGSGSTGPDFEATLALSHFSETGSELAGASARMPGQAAATQTGDLTGKTHSPVAPVVPRGSLAENAPRGNAVVANATAGSGGAGLTASGLLADSAVAAAAGVPAAAGGSADVGARGAVPGTTGADVRKGRAADKSTSGGEGSIRDVGGAVAVPVLTMVALPTPALSLSVDGSGKTDAGAKAVGAVPAGRGETADQGAGLSLGDAKRVAVVPWGAEGSPVRAGELRAGGLGVTAAEMASAGAVGVDDTAAGMKGGKAGVSGAEAPQKADGGAAFGNAVTAAVPASGVAVPAAPTLASPYAPSLAEAGAMPTALQVEAGAESGVAGAPAAGVGTGTGTGAVGVRGVSSGGQRGSGSSTGKREGGLGEAGPGSTVAAGAQALAGVAEVGTGAGGGTGNGAGDGFGALVGGSASAGHGPADSVSSAAATSFLDAAGAAATGGATSTIGSSRLMQTMSGTEMRVGLHSEEFGSISIAASLSAGSIATQISLEHAALGHALTAHLPEMAEKLEGAFGVQARVEVRDSGMGAQGQAQQGGTGGGSMQGGVGSGGSGSGTQGSASRGGASGAGAATAVGSVAALARASISDGLGGLGRLSVQA